MSKQQPRAGRQSARTQFRRRNTPVGPLALLLASVAWATPGAAVAASSAGSGQQAEASQLGDGGIRARELYNRGEYKAAEPLYQALLAEQERTLPKGDPAALITASELAILYTRLRRFDEAEPLFLRAIAGLDRALGPDHADTLITVNDLAFTYQQQGRLAEAEPLFVRALKGQEKTLGAEHRHTLITMSSLGGLYLDLKRNADAEPLLRRALEGQQRVFGRDHAETATTQGRLARLSMTATTAPKDEQSNVRPVEEAALVGGIPSLAECDQAPSPSPGCVDAWTEAGRTQNSEPLARKAVDLGERLAMEGSRPSALRWAYDGLIDMLNSQARFREAEAFARKRVALAAAAWGDQSFEHMGALGELGYNLNEQRRHGDADAILRRAIALQPPSNPDVVMKRILLSNNLAMSLRGQGRLKEATAVFFEAATLLYRQLKDLGMTGKDLEAPSNFVAAKGNDEGVRSTMESASTLLNNLGAVLQAQDDSAEAIKFFEEAARFSEAVSQPFEMYKIWNNIGLTYSSLKRPQDAIAPLDKAAAIAQSHFGARHPNTQTIEANLGFVKLFELGRPADALVNYRRATQGMIEELRTAVVPDEAEARLKRSEMIFRNSLEAMWKTDAGSTAASANGERSSEAFETAQWAMSGEAAAALTRVAARFASGEGQLGQLEQRRQELNRQRIAAERDYFAAIGNSGTDASPARRLDEIDRNIATVTSEIAALDPGYDDLIRPAALPLTEAQQLLTRDEALLLFLVNDDAVYTFAVTGERVEWVRNETFNAKALRAKVRELRRQIGVEEARGLVRDDADGKSFDRILAFELYEGLIRPVEHVLAGKTELLTVRDGPLGALPLQLLVTERPTGSNSDPQAAKNTKWLIDRYAIANLPAVSSLKALRCLLVDPSRRHAGCSGAAAGRAKSARSADVLLAGFGAPTLRGAPSISRSVPPSFETSFKGGLADTEALRNLAYLPGSKAELEALETQFATGGVVIKTGDAATERQVKNSSDLSAARFAVFSTHGLVSGETGLIGEPGLVFTPPAFAARSEIDDGLLTASEAAKLSLSADLVVLSACNTAAPSGSDGGEGLSGLARSFFFAGARSLLVSHWPVSDTATSALIVDTFRRMEANPAQSRAVAFREAMQELRKDSRWASPVYWAPFELVGVS